MKGFLKEHFVLIAGLALPLVLSAFFFLAANVPVNMVDPPRYAAVYAYEYYYGNNPQYPYKIAVDKQGTVVLHYFPPKDESAGNWNLPVVYVFDPKTMKGEQVELPRIEDSGKKSVIPVETLSDIKVSSSEVSPDGFRIIQDYRGGGNLMTSIFGGGHSGGYRHFFIKDKNRFKVEFESGRYLGNGKLVGWIVEEKAP